MKGFVIDSNQALFFIRQGQDEKNNPNMIYSQHYENLYVETESNFDSTQLKNRRLIPYIFLIQRVKIIP